jgi:hypothetical protein
MKSPDEVEIGRWEILANAKIGDPLRGSLVVYAEVPRIDLMSSEKF